jgi:hypothetical protein
MIHSIPMAILLGQLTFFFVTGMMEERLLKAGALTAGFLSHLILDEIFSIDSTGAKLRLKKSFGTALKWANPKQKAPVAVIHASIFCLGLIGLSHPDVIERSNAGIELAKQTSANGNAPSDTPLLAMTQSEQRDVQREAAEFLAQATVATVVQPYSQPLGVSPLAPPLSVPVSSLPPIMQIEYDWNRNVPMQPARIVLP